MTLPNARKLRDRIRDEAQYHCTVPVGYAWDKYFARIYSSRETGVTQAVDFHSEDEWEAYKAWLDKDEAEKQRRLRPRSALDIMIDRACGLE